MSQMPDAAAEAINAIMARWTPYFRTDASRDRLLAYPAIGALNSIYERRRDELQRIADDLTRRRTWKELEKLFSDLDDNTRKRAYSKLLSLLVAKAPPRREPDDKVNERWRSIAQKVYELRKLIEADESLSQWPAGLLAEIDAPRDGIKDVSGCRLPKFLANLEKSLNQGTKTLWQNNESQFAPPYGKGKTERQNYLAHILASRFKVSFGHIPYPLIAELVGVALALPDDPDPETLRRKINRLAQDFPHLR